MVRFIEIHKTATALKKTHIQKCKTTKNIKAKFLKLMKFKLRRTANRTVNKKFEIPDN